MSAITGIFYRDGRKVDPDLIKKMNDKLSHRGPDGSDIWCEGSVALGHQMLWTTPESLHEKLPFEEDGLVITADARIDNRDELSEELEILDEEHISDSYFILKAYQKWGENCPDKLLGDFAFAIWDQNKEKLFCARDHMGVKPFYYYLDDEKFVFGTEIKPLFLNKYFKKKLNELRIADYLVPIFDDKEITFYENIKRLPSAFKLIINPNKSYLSDYWSLNFRNRIYFDSNKEYSDVFKSIFTESMNCRLRSSFNIGSMLSGGLDSSSITCTASKILSPTTLQTFSAVFDDVPQCDERNYIQSILKDKNIVSNYINADKISPLFDIDKVLWHLDEPLYAPNLFIHWNIYKKAHENNVRIILDGYDGDTTVSHGEKFFVELACNFKVMKLLDELRNHSRNTGINIENLFLYHVILPVIPFDLKYFLRRIRYFLKNYNRDNIVNQMVLNENFQKKTNISNRYISLQKNKNTRDSHKYHYFKIKHSSIQYVLEILDKSSAAFSIEPRYPFFDKRLIEFCLALPTEQKLSKGWDRIILRRAMKNVLPSEIQNRKRKTNLEPNFLRSFQLYEKKRAQKVFDSSIIGEYIDLKFLKSISTSYDKDILTNKEIYSLWKFVNLKLWLESIENK